MIPGFPGFEPPVPPEPNAFQWATVTATGPLRVMIDGQAAELPFTPDTLVGGLAVDDRVWTQTYGRRLIILGRAAG